MVVDGEVYTEALKFSESVDAVIVEEGNKADAVVRGVGEIVAPVNEAAETAAREAPWVAADIVTLGGGGGVREAYEEGRDLTDPGEVAAAYAEGVVRSVPGVEEGVEAYASGESIPSSVVTGGQEALKAALSLEDLQTATDPSQAATTRAAATGRAAINLVLLAATKGKAKQTRGVNRARRLRKQGLQEHHIISHRNPFTREHELLELAGFDLQSRKNKIFLPARPEKHARRSIHRGRHTSDVSTRLAEEMDQIVAEGKAQAWTQQEYNNALRRLIREERKSLRAGRRALNVNKRPGAQ